MKKFLSVLLTLCMVIPMFAALPISAAKPTDGFTFDGDEWYYADGTLSSAPRTVEAWIYVDPAHATERSTVISNYNAFQNYAYWHFDLKYENNTLFPYFEWNELYNNTADGGYIRKFNFRNAVITAGVWTHIAIVIDAANNYVSCYKDGQHIQNNNGGFTLCDIADNVTELPLVIGNDCRAAAEGTDQFRAFNGKISSISLFDDVRTATEISSDYSNGADTSDKNALAHWEFSSSAKAVEDKVGNVDLSHSKFWLSESEMSAIRGSNFDPAYSFAVVGDIQYITEYDVANGTDYVEQIHSWIGNNAASNKKNIQFVMGVGDITNQDTDAEWQLAYNAISGTLNGKVNYSLVRGNHDLYKGGTGFDTYFGSDSTYTSLYKGSKGGTYKSGSYINSYTTFTVGSTKWLIINLDFAASDDVLEWANSVVSSHPDHKVIMTTHGYAHMDGTPISDEDSGSLWGDTKNNGEEMWTKFASLHENMVMVISGHMESNLITIKQAKGVHGNTVSQFLIDQQTLDKKYMSLDGKPLGLVAMFYFDKDGKNVSVEWYSTLRNKYFQTRNQISFDMTADAPEQTFGWCGVSYTPKGSGTKSDPYIIENGGNLLWISEKCKDTNGTAPVFKNTYFKQVCDIDLNGNTLKSIGHYHTTENDTEKMAAFGGYYDGGNYSIKNGRISAQNVHSAHNIVWSGGLFGAIYGATIKNVILEDLDIYSKGVTGALVGRAIAPFNGSATEEFNLISGCSVKSSCNIYAYLCLGNPVNEATTYGSQHHAGIVGSICGMAYGTTIQGCTSDVNITVDGNHSVVGGIVGTAGYNSKINACAFIGSITLTGTSSKTPASVGGIVGAVIPNANSSTAYTGDNTVGSLKVANCYNNGSFSFTGTSANEVHWGGIIGNASNLYDLSDCVTVSDSYNLYERETESVLSSNSNYWAGGIIGRAASTNGAHEGSVIIKNSASVAISAAGGKGTNEYRYLDVKTSSSLPPAQADASVKTLTSNDMSDSIFEIDKLIKSIQPNHIGLANKDDNDTNNDNDNENNNISTPENTKPGGTTGTTQKPEETTTAATTTAKRKRGCGGVVSAASALICVLAIGTGISLKKKND